MFYIVIVMIKEKPDFKALLVKKMIDDNED
jgi:hypothetical protein